MGRYTNYEEVITRYPLLSTWGKKQSEVENDLITNAEAELDGRLGRAYSVPFSAAHQTIKDIAIDLCYLKALRTRDAKKYTEVASSIMGYIDDLISGKAVVVTGSGTIEPNDPLGVGIWGEKTSYLPTFSMLDAEDAYSRVDSSLLYDERTARGDIG